MKNIFQIFYHDIKKIRKNVIALIVILGITIVPSLYALFRLFMHGSILLQAGIHMEIQET